MTKRSAVAVVFGIAAATLSASASAADLQTPTGGKGQFVLDQLAGFRAGNAASPTGNISYSGFIGFSYSHFSQNKPAVGGVAQGGYDAYNYTSFWLAPTLDYFVLEHFSIGGLVELSYTSASHDEQMFNNGQVVTTSLPGIVNFTLLPRLGYIFPIGDWHVGRFAIWPRVGAGYGMRQYVDNNGDTNTFSGFVLDVDVGFLLRINETFFFKLTPEMTFIPGSASRTVGNTSVSLGASDFQIAILGGLGVML
jgi:hypothetical protein